MKKLLNSDYVTYELNDGLLKATFKEGLHIHLDVAKEIVDTRLRFTEYKPVIVLILNQGVVEMDKPAREFLASGEGTQNIIATAIVLKSGYGTMLGNFFLKVNKPAMPVKIFSDEIRALRWLNKFIL